MDTGCADNSSALTSILLLSSWFLQPKTPILTRKPGPTFFLTWTILAGIVAPLAPVRHLVVAVRAVRTAFAREQLPPCRTGHALVLSGAAASFAAHVATLADALITVVTRRAGGLTLATLQLENVSSSNSFVISPDQSFNQNTVIMVFLDCVNTYVINIFTQPKLTEFEG